jgi:Ca2+-binding RTX toxin-like protein
LHLFGEMEANSFASIIMRNTDATHLPSDVFSTPAFILEVNQNIQFNDLNGDGVMEHTDPTSGGLLAKLVIRNDPGTPGADTNYLKYTGEDHVVMGGTEGNDRIYASVGDDTLYGDGGNDYLDGGFGNDIINGGAGNDIIRDIGGDDNIKGGDGDDAIHAGPGLDLVLAGKGNDFVVLGTDMGSEVFGGEGNDFILGNKNAERILGNEGDDWLETGTFDGAPGDNFDEIFARDQIDGNDVFLGDGGFDEFIGEGGDDIMVGSLGRGKMAGMSGFDWVTYKDNGQGVNADLSIPIVFDEAPTLPPNTALDEFESLEGLSGTKYNDVLKGSEDIAADRATAALGGTSGFQGSLLDAQGIALIAGLQAVLGAGVTSYDAGDIILGGDGSDRIQGNGGDDIIDGDKWLDVGIGVYALADVNHTGTPLKVVKSMKDLSADVFSGVISPSQLKIVREIKADTTAGDVDIAMFRGDRGEYAFSATNDGQVIVTHAIENAIDGSDRLRNMERVEFATGNALNIIVGTPAADTLNGTADDDLMLGLDGIDTLNGGAGNDILVGGPNGGSTGGAYADNFNIAALNNSTGTTSWTATPWVETNDGTGTSNQIRIDDGNNNVLRFYGGANMNGAEITRAVNLAGATTATITYDFDADNLDAGEAVRVMFAADGVNYVLLNTIDFNDTGNDFSHVVSGPFSATARIRFEATGINTGDENVEINDLQISYTSVETLNGGLGDDTYSFSVGDGNDVINEGVSATSGGAADRISILAPLDPITGLAVLAGLDAFDSNTSTTTGDLVISYTMLNGVTPSTQVTTVAGHFTGTNAQTGVERINFNSATYAGYLLGPDDYLISRLDPANRDAGGVNLTASTANNFIVGEQGVNDIITGGSGNDLIFGGTGDNTLNGGLGDDLLVGGSGAGDNDRLDGGSGVDTMIGGGGNDTYVIDDVADVVVEAANAGTDEVETDFAAFSLELLTTVEDLTYTGVDADQFIGTGNALNNVISGGDLADTLSGLDGNDTLNGGIGADTLTGGIGNDTLNGGADIDTMIGGAGNDTYVVDNAADVVNESTGLATDVDTVVSGINYVLGAALENLTLTGTAIAGSGHSGNNVLTGNALANELFGGGGNDTLNGDDGNDLLDGGAGNDTINGGAGNDGIIGGAGNDTIDLGTGFNTLIYNAANFGNDIVTSFDSVGGTATTQDLIDLRALGVTAANFASRVTIEDVEDGTVDDTLITVRDASNAVVGTIRLEELEATGANGVTAADFILAQPTPAAFGAPTNAANTITGTAAANLINGLGGNDTLNGGAGDDVVNGDEGADTLNGGAGNDTLAGGTGSDAGLVADNFDTSSFGNSTGGFAWGSSWLEANDNGVANTGQIRIDDGNNVMRFHGGVGAAFDGAQISRTINLDGAASATLTYSADPNGLDAGETLTVQFAADGINFVNLQTITGDGVSTNYSHNLAGPLSANSAIRFVVSGVNATNEFVSVDNVAINFVKPGLNAGVDTINGDTGDDTIVWNANASGATDGRDVVNGGTEDFAGDTFEINGNNTAETYRIYTRAEFDAVPNNTLTGIAAGTEIIITRNGTDAASIIAELTEIEEIRINGSDPAGGGASLGDNFELIGDFSGTSLRLNTVTIQGGSGTDSVDISQLTSGHRIVFDTNGGGDSVLGALRPQDVVDGTAGADAGVQMDRLVSREAYTGGHASWPALEALQQYQDRFERHHLDAFTLRFDFADNMMS